MEILKINPKKPERKKILLIADLLKKGKVIILPTDTVYGLVCDATNKKAVQKIFKIKERPKNKSLPLFVKNTVVAKQVAEINKKQENFLKKNWPGKTTIILKRRGKQKLCGLNKDTIALRIPKYTFLNNLLKEINIPLAQTSANISGDPVSPFFREVLNGFKNKKIKPDIAVDGGDLSNRSSTVVDLTRKTFKTLRK